MYYYDEPDLDEIYVDSANAQIDEEMETLDECFKEWAHDYDHVPEDATEDDYALASTDPATRDAYRNFRFDAVVQDLAERAADYADYCACEAAEAAREARLLGE